MLAAVPLLGHLPATLLLDRRAPRRTCSSRWRAASGAPRSSPRKPPSTIEEGWTVEPRAGLHRAPAPAIGDDGTVTGEVAWVPDAPGRRRARRRRRRTGARARSCRPRTRAVEPVAALRRDALARPRALRRARRGTVLDVDAEATAPTAWYLAAGAAGRGVASARSSSRWRLASPTPRSASRSGARSAPTRRSSTSSSRSCGRLENARSLHVLRGLGGARTSRTSSPLAASAFRLVGGRGDRPRRAHADLRARRHRRDLGARRAAVLPPRAALAAAARRRPATRPTGSPTSCSRRRGRPAAA